MDKITLTFSKIRREDTYLVIDGEISRDVEKVAIFKDLVTSPVQIQHPDKKVLIVCYTSEDFDNAGMNQLNYSELSEEIKIKIDTLIS
jgi:hypothetical protein